MVGIHHELEQDIVIVEDQQQLPSLSGNTTMVVEEASITVEQLPLRKREPPPTVGRDNSTTRYMNVKHKHMRMGVRRMRRWDNLLTLRATLEALGPFEEDEPIAPPMHSAITDIITSGAAFAQWEQVSSEETEIMHRLAKLRLSCTFEDLTHAHSPFKRYMKISRAIRLAMRKNIPMGLLARLEAEVIDAFSTDCSAVLVVALDDSFSRLMLHGVCQYLGLHSISETVEGKRLTSVRHTSPELGFQKPDVLLSALIAARDHD